MTSDVSVLFVCVHNAARSRMAEALLCKLGGPRFEVTSAGFEPHEANPLAREALASAGLSLPYTGLQPSVFELFKAGRHFDHVIGVCNEEHGQRCPLFAGMTQRLFWSFPDPSTFTGDRSGGTGADRREPRRDQKPARGVGARATDHAARKTENMSTMQTIQVMQRESSGPSTCAS